MSEFDVRILIVEDDKMVMKVLAGFLEKIGNTQIVGQADSCMKSKKILQEHQVDLILLDLYLPDGNGLDLLKWVRQNDIDVDIILITADRQIESILEARKYGAKDYLIKPFKYDRLEKAIEDYRSEVNKLSNLEIIDQSTIDSLIHKENFNHTGGGINHTYDSILSYLQNHYPIGYTSSEIAQSLGVSRITARRYLESMENSGVVTLELDYGNVGRPKNKFSYLKR